MLLAAGARADAVDSEGETPADAASEAEIGALLLSALGRA